MSHHSPDTTKLIQGIIQHFTTSQCNTAENWIILSMWLHLPNTNLLPGQGSLPLETSPPRPSYKELSQGLFPNSRFTVKVPIQHFNKQPSVDLLLWQFIALEGQEFCSQKTFIFCRVSPPKWIPSISQLYNAYPKSYTLVWVLWCCMRPDLCLKVFLHSLQS